MADFPSSDTEPLLPLEPAPRRTRPRQRFRTALEARQWRRRMLGYAVTGLSCLLVINALVGENGYLASIRVRRQSADLTAQLRHLREENQRIQNDIIRLRTDPTALEEAARRDLRLKKEGETMVVIKNAAKPK